MEIRNIISIFDCGELLRAATSSVLELLQPEGNRMVKRTVELFNLDVIISVGYRVNTSRGIQFRQWALQIAFFIRTNQPPIEGVFYEGQVLDARDFAETLIKSAQKEVLLIDNYIDARTFEILEVRGDGVSAAIYVERVGSGLRTLQQVSAQQTSRQIDLRETTQRIHDRFLIIDDVVYHLGASLNELGRRLFAFSKMSIRKEQIL